MACCHFHLAYWVAVLNEMEQEYLVALIFPSMDCFSVIDVYQCASSSETTTTNIIKTEKWSELRDLRENCSKTARDYPYPPA